MIKLYFKKIFWAILLITMILVIYYVGFNTLYTIANIFDKESPVWHIILFGIPALGSLFFLYCIRIGNREKRTQYVNDLRDDRFAVLKDVLYIIKSKDYMAEILALHTIALPLFLFAGINEKTPLIPFLLGTIALIAISSIVFSIVDISLWLLVHKSWLKY